MSQVTLLSVDLATPSENKGVEMMSTANNNESEGSFSQLLERQIQSEDNGNNKQLNAKNEAVTSGESAKSIAAKDANSSDNKHAEDKHANSTDDDKVTAKDGHDNQKPSDDSIAEQANKDAKASEQGEQANSGKEAQDDGSGVDANVNTQEQTALDDASDLLVLLTKSEKLLNSDASQPENTAKVVLTDVASSAKKLADSELLMSENQKISEISNKLNLADKTSAEENKQAKTQLDKSADDADNLINSLKAQMNAEQEKSTNSPLAKSQENNAKILDKTGGNSADIDANVAKNTDVDKHQLKANVAQVELADETTHSKNIEQVAENKTVNKMAIKTDGEKANVNADEKAVKADKIVAQLIETESNLSQQEFEKQQVLAAKEQLLTGEKTTESAQKNNENPVKSSEQILTSSTQNKILSADEKEVKTEQSSASQKQSIEVHLSKEITAEKTAIAQAVSNATPAKAESKIAAEFNPLGTSTTQSASEQSTKDKSSAQGAAQTKEHVTAQTEVEVKKSALANQTQVDQKIATTPSILTNTFGESSLSSGLMDAQQVTAQFESLSNKQVADNVTQVKANQMQFAEAINIHRKDFADAVKNKVMVMISQKLQQADITLDPPELGNVQVRINLQGDAAAVNFVVQNSQAKDALEQHMNKLRDMLSESGVDVGDANVRQQQQESGQSGDGAQDGSTGQLAEQSAQELTEEALLASRLVKASATGVDFYA